VRKAGIALQFLVERLRVHSQGSAGGLHHSFDVVVVGPEQDRQPDHAVFAGQPDLGSVAILQVGQHGGPAGLGEIDDLDGVARRVQDFAEGKFNGFELRPEPGEVVGRQGREQAVTGRGSRLSGEVHRGLLRRGVGGSAGLSLPPAPKGRGGR
jgi:hypothetical protein